MPIELRAYNLQAYGQAVAVVVQTGKGSVIYPEGAGKTVVGFQCCSDYPDK